MLFRSGGGRYKKKLIQEVYAFIQGKSAEYSVSELCRLNGVSRSGYYKLLARNNQTNRYECARGELDEYVRDIHAHNPSMGYRQIRDMLLLQTGWKVCDISVWKSMRHTSVWVSSAGDPAKSTKDMQIF